MNSKVAQIQPPVAILLEKHIYEHLGLKAKVAVQQANAGTTSTARATGSYGCPDASTVICSVPTITTTPAQDQDPLVQIKQQELQLREQEMMADQQTDQRKLALDQQRQQQQFPVRPR